MTCLLGNATGSGGRERFRCQGNRGTPGSGYVALSLPGPLPHGVTAILFLYRSLEAGYGHG